MLKFVNMNTTQNVGAVSLKDSILELEGWTDAVYQQNFMDFLEQQPYIMGTLMEADEGMDDGTHSWMLKSVLLLKCILGVAVGGDPMQQTSDAEVQPVSQLRFIICKSSSKDDASRTVANQFLRPINKKMETYKKNFTILFS